MARGAPRHLLGARATAKRARSALVPKVCVSRTEGQMGKGPRHHGGWVGAGGGGADLHPELLTTNY